MNQYEAWDNQIENSVFTAIKPYLSSTETSLILNLLGFNRSRTAVKRHATSTGTRFKGHFPKNAEIALKGSEVFLKIALKEQEAVIERLRLLSRIYPDQLDEVDIPIVADVNLDDPIVLMLGEEPPSEPNELLNPYLLRIKKLETEIKRFKEERELISDKILINEILERAYKFDEHKKTIWTPAKPSKQEAVLMSLLSDMHFSEVIDPAQVDYINVYNKDVATKRIDRYFDGLVEKKNAFRNLSVNKVYISILGDVFAGRIHEELLETNEETILQSLVYWLKAIKERIEYLANEFDYVGIICKEGNHGRQTTKPRMKSRAYENFDWLFYQLLAIMLEKNNKVEFNISDGNDPRFKVYNKVFRCSHGDEVQGGTGMTGAIPVILRWLTKKLEQARVTGKPFDVFLMGHIHQYIHYKNKIIVNSSVVGYDEFAYQKALESELPQQAWWVLKSDGTFPYHGSLLLEDENFMDNYKE